MQSGRASQRVWVLQFSPTFPQSVDPVMGWISSSDMGRQVFLSFKTKDQAIAFAEKNGLSWEVNPSVRRNVTPKNYGDNFRADRRRN